MRSWVVGSWIHACSDDDGYERDFCMSAEGWIP
jgi:hypothetical protein